MKPEFNLTAIKGEPGTGYEDNPGLKCECKQDDMREKSRQPKTSNGNRVVTDKSCCEYIDRERKPGPFECGNCEYVVGLNKKKGLAIHFMS